MDSIAYFVNTSRIEGNLLSVSLPRGEILLIEADAPCTRTSIGDPLLRPLPSESLLSLRSSLSLSHNSLTAGQRSRVKLFITEYDDDVRFID